MWPRIPKELTSVWQEDVVKHPEKIHCTDHSMEKVNIGGNQVQNSSAIL